MKRSAHLVRGAFWLTFLAVTIGVGFVAGVITLTDTISRTFDDLFADIARGNGAQRPVATETQRGLVLRRALASTPLVARRASAALRPGRSRRIVAIHHEHKRGGRVEPDGLAHRWRQIKAYWKLYPFSH